MSGGCLISMARKALRAMLAQEGFFVFWPWSCFRIPEQAIQVRRWRSEVFGSQSLMATSVVSRRPVMVLFCQTTKAGAPARFAAGRSSGFAAAVTSVFLRSNLLRRRMMMSTRFGKSLRAAATT